MTLVVVGLDALDPELVNEDEHQNLALEARGGIRTIASSTGEPSTHELWPTIITGLRPSEHGLTLENDGVAWDNRLFETGSAIADHVLPDGLQNRIGAWLLTNTDSDAFRTSATYYEKNGIGTVFDGRDAKPIGIPNYVLNSDEEDREHSLRRSLGDLFERDPDAKGGHRSSDPETFYERCLEMAMIRLARTRRALRSGRYELVFGYTSGLDLVGHVSYDSPEMQAAAYDELDEFVGELRADLAESDELLLVSDHGLQDGVHTNEAMVAGTDSEIVDQIESVLDVRSAIEATLEEQDHHGHSGSRWERADDGDRGDHVRSRLEDLGYM